MLSLFKNPKFYFVVLLILVIATGAALFYVERQNEAKLAEIAAIEDVYFEHPQWSSDMVIEGNRIYRANAPGEQATITEKTPTSYTLKWDRWGTEVFEKQPNGVYKKKE